MDRCRSSSQEDQEGGGLQLYLRTQVKDNGSREGIYPDDRFIYNKETGVDTGPVRATGRKDLTPGCSESSGRSPGRLNDKVFLMRIFPDYAAE